MTYNTVKQVFFGAIKFRDLVEIDYFGAIDFRDLPARCHNVVPWFSNLAQILCLVTMFYVSLLHKVHCNYQMWWTNKAWILRKQSSALLTSKLCSMLQKWTKIGGTFFGVIYHVIYSGQLNFGILWLSRNSRNSIAPEKYLLYSILIIF